MGNKTINVILLQCAVVIFSLSGIFSKKASEFDLLSIEYLFYYGLTLLILFVYAILWQQILKKFSLTVAYANKGTLPLITMLWGWLLFGETITLNMIIGAIVIVFGVGVVVTDND